MSSSRPNPTNFEDYQYGTSHRGSVSSSTGRSLRFTDHGRDVSPSERLLQPGGRGLDGERGGQGEQALRRRRSSIAMHLGALKTVGGVNSIENFARSWTRAAGFVEVIPSRPTYVLAAGGESGPYALENGETSSDERNETLQGQLSSSYSAGETAILDTEDELEDAFQPERATSEDLDKYNSLDPGLGSVRSRISGGGRRSIFAPYLVSPLAASYGTSYGTIQSTGTASSMIHAGDLWRQQQVTGSANERDPILVKQVEEDGEIKLAPAEGFSTQYQTIFNSTNVLVGVGLLSLPLGIKYSGWLFGVAFLLYAALTTMYTAKLLAKCLDTDPFARSFSDLALMAYGERARNIVAVIFVFELLTACVALVTLFGDTMFSIDPHFSRNEWKIICGLVLVPLQFVPFRLLSFTSVLGILSCFGIVTAIVISGFTKHHSPGSLREVAATYWFPANWLTLPLSFGLFMAPWGGHGVFPNMYRDMRHPRKYSKAISVTFAFTLFLDASTAITGILMFGDDIQDEITSNILEFWVVATRCLLSRVLETKGYPKYTAAVISTLIAIIPLTKLPLNSRPMVETIESFTGLGHRSHISVGNEAGSLSTNEHWSQRLKNVQFYADVLIRISMTVIFVSLSILFPSFDSLMSFMGSLMCNLVCIILPLSFHLKIFGNDIGLKERALNYTLIFISSTLAVVGTVFACLPKELIGAT